MYPETFPSPTDCYVPRNVSLTASHEFHYFGQRKKKFIGFFFVLFLHIQFKPKAIKRQISNVFFLHWLLTIKSAIHEILPLICLHLIPIPKTLQCNINSQTKRFKTKKEIYRFVKNRVSFVFAMELPMAKQKCFEAKFNQKFSCGSIQCNFTVSCTYEWL